MKINVQLSEDEFLSTAEKSYDMKIEAKNTPLMFKMLVDQLYKNKLGSMIRELTSNAVDSHVEAGVTEPVVVKLSKEFNTNYISFIDNGVGMSPDRVVNIYGSLGESTKRDTNNQIGGFGIGGKTGLAYNKSFFLITRFDGIEYFYNIRMDNYVPKIELMQESETKERNGTEIKVPLKNDSEIHKAELEIKKQLLYFDNIMYLGWNKENISNDFKIYEGKHFKYRNTVFNYMHICLGDVAYPIDWDTLGMSKINIPVGIKFNTGDLRTVPSREDVEYTDEAIELIKNKIDLIKEELGEMLTKKYSNIVTLEDYYNANENFGHIVLGQDKIFVGDLVKRSQINYTNFRYVGLLDGMNLLPSRDWLLENIFTIKRYGKVPPKRSWKSDGAFKFNYRVENLEKDEHNVYCCDGEFTRNLNKQSYLKDLHKGRFYILTRNSISDKDQHMLECGVVKHLYNITDEKRELFDTLSNEFVEYIYSLTPNYNDVEVPSSFIAARKKKSYNKKELVNFKDIIHNTNKKLNLEKISKFRGTLVYGFRDDNLIGAYNMSLLFFDNNKLYTNIISYYGNLNNGMCFSYISKGNHKTLKEVGINMVHVNDFYKIYGKRKIDKLKNLMVYENVMEDYSKVSEIFRKIDFTDIDLKVKQSVDIISDWVKNNKVKNDYSGNLSFMYERITGESIGDINKLITFKDELDYLLDKTKELDDLFKFIKLPYYLNETEEKNLIDLLKKVVN